MSVKLDTERLNQLIANAPGEFSKTVREAAFAIESTAKDLAPKGPTGALSGGITAEEISNTLWQVRDSVEYGIYQELGFVHWRGGQFIQNPFLVPAFEKEKKVLERRIREFFRR